MDACVLPGPQAMDCYYGATTPDVPVSFPPSWCSVINNNQFFAFTATMATATFSISCYGCASGNGIQAAVLSTTDCTTFGFVSPCLGNIATQTTQSLTATGLVPGETYYLCIDGSGGALCDYSINGSVPTVNGPEDPCLPGDPTSTFTTQAPSNWTLNPPSAGSIVGPSNNTPSLNVQWATPGYAEICAQNANCPDSPLDCIDVNVGENTQTDELVQLCQGKTTECAGRTFTAGGTFQVSLPSFGGCDSIINCIVSVIPTVITNETWMYCEGQSVECAGEEFFNQGIFPITLTNFQGCDSIVRCNIVRIPTYVSPYSFVNICGPGGYMVCETEFTESGVFSEVCTNSMGCDSIVNVNLAILNPNAVIAPPAVLDCTTNATITLNGSGSTLNTAVGGSTLYSWSGPGIVGFSNQANVTVNQPGQYCLILTHGRGGIYCADTACVTVTAVSAVPPVPTLIGEPDPCSNTSIIYSAVAGGFPPATQYNWTTPGNITYTTVAFDSIQINWLPGGANGNLCVTAQNGCGASQPGCLPIVVQQPLLAPVLAGPATVCAGGGNYLFKIDTLYPNSTYNWSVPSGAVVSGAGDSIYVNFNASVSGQVCVQALNNCDTLPPVCQNIQVSPVPTVDLTGDATICNGESVTLTFTMTGNGPFDIGWTDGSANFQLTDVVSGHTINLTPSQNTTYSLTSFNDGTAPLTCAGTANDAVTATVWQHTTTSLAPELCDGASLFVGGALQTTSGVYVDSFQTFHGCDSVVTTTLTVYAIDSMTIDLTTCDPSAAGTTVQMLTQFNGCDSIVTTNVTLLPSNSTDITYSSCDINDVGVFTQNLLNQFGCDSIVTTTVTFSLSDTTYLTASSCDPSSIGTFLQQLVGVDGCDSLVYTAVSLLPSSVVNLTGSSCNPSEVGVFQQDLTNQYGCDSTVITTITQFYLDTTFLTAGNCDPAATGVFSQTLVTAAGCDSIITTTVSLLPSSTTNLAGSSCNPNEVGVFQQDLTNYLGCDSTVITTITQFYLDTTFLTAGNCDPAATGVFSQTLVTAGGCDSIITTTVSLLPSSTTNLAGSSCNPNEVGVFQQDLTNYLGCDSTVITTITQFYLDTTFLTAGNCDPAATGVFSQTLVTAGGCDSIITTTVSLLPSSTTQLTGADCNPANVGVFTQVLSNQYGCDSTVVTTVSLLPSDQVAIQSTTCDPTASGVFTYNLTNQWGCDSTVTETVVLLPSDVTNLTFTTCETAQVGTVTTVLTNQYGCDSTVIAVTTLLAIDNCSVTASLSGSTIPCGSNTGTVSITASVGIAPFDYTVLQNGTPVATGTLNAVGTPETVSGLAPGNYTVEVSSPNGYSNTASATIVQLFPPTLTAAVSSDFNGADISCTGGNNGSALATPAGGLAPFTYVWSNGSSSAQANSLPAGAYTVTVTDANQCTNTATVSLVDPQPMTFSTNLKSPDCLGDKNGVISVTAVGGVAPYQYSLGFSAFQSNPIFNGLSDGTYDLTVMDANGCQEEDAILLNPGSLIEVDLGNDQTIALGESTTIEAFVSIPRDSILSVTWTPSFDTTACPECLEQEITPGITTTYTIVVEDINGCTDQDRVTVVVDRRKDIFAPNIFSPNDDGVNDIFHLFAKEGLVTNIKSFQIYDRWGDAIFERTDIQANDPNVGWDGKFRGDKLQPGVYVWYAEITFRDGETILYEGDVTLMR
ncbi:MAG: gliding motility-associated C-terminal domain-containing protein [Saprospiraceae bacterium]|nr:gliding motility-associated C-terminal domain-containing protein [Saprospiraceae bacterium]